MRSASPCRLAALALCAAGSLRGGVAVSEIHYNPGPAEDSTIEFVELINTGGDAVDLAGWRFTEGIQYVFPPETRLEAGGCLVVCRNRARFLARYGLSGDGVAGDFAGRLDDNGERLVLRDGGDRIADVVGYHDLAPWPENADGLGASSHQPETRRLCRVRFGDGLQNIQDATPPVAARRVKVRRLAGGLAVHVQPRQVNDAACRQ